MNPKAIIPNSLTLANLTCGIFCIIYVQNPDLLLTFFLLAGVFDFLDGFTARLLKVNSEMGKQLDSLADVVTFGVVPGYIWYYECLHHPYVDGWSFALSHLFLLLPIASAYRLAKFNISTDQTTDFKGLPTPANAFFWVGLFYCYAKNAGYALFGSIDPALFFYALIIFALLFSLLLISNISVFGLKFKSFAFTENRWKYFLLTLALILLVFLKWLALPIIVILYIVLSLIKNWSS